MENIKKQLRNELAREFINSALQGRLMQDKLSSYQSNINENFVKGAFQLADWYIRETDKD